MCIARPMTMTTVSEITLTDFSLKNITCSINLPNQNKRVPTRITFPRAVYMISYLNKISIKPTDRKA